MGKTVLVCERKSLARVSYRGTLALHGYDVVGEAVTGLELLRQYELHKPDLILMSAVLSEPGGDGLLVVRKLLDDHPEATVIAYADPRIRSEQACMDAGCKGFFVYPARPDEMLAVVKQVIG